MHTETTEKEKGGEGVECKKKERARERAAGERVYDKESERRALQTKEKSVTHGLQEGQRKKQKTKNNKKEGGKKLLTASEKEE